MDPRRVEWVGTTLCEWSYSSPAMARELSQYMPVYAGPAYGPDSLHDKKHIIRCDPDASAAIARVCESADVILSWGVYHLDVMLYNWIHQRGLISVTVSHCEGPQYEMAASEPGATHFTAVCERAKAVYSDKTRRDVTVIHNGADVHRISPTASRDKVREDWGYGSDDRLVGYLGRLSPEKNPTAIAAGVAHLPSNYHAVFVGEGWRATETQQEVQKLIPDRCLFVPSMKQVGNALQAFDVMVLASFTEAFSLSMIEAWLSGCPVAVTPVGALRELEALHGPVAIDMPYNPAGPQVAEAVKKACSGAGKHLARKCKQIAWENYTTPAMVERWTSYLEGITGRDSLVGGQPTEVIWAR